MYQAFECCNAHQLAPRESNSLTSICWPTTNKERPITVLEKLNHCCCPPNPEITWPLHQPWIQNQHQSRCDGQGRCQNDPTLCSSKHHYGAAVVCPCPSVHSDKGSTYICPCPEDCPKQSCDLPTCKKSNSCMDWPVPAVQAYGTLNRH